MSITSIHSTNMTYGNLNVYNGRVILQRIGDEKTIKAGCGDTAPVWHPGGISPGSEFGCLAAIELPTGSYALTGVREPGGGGYSANKTPYDFRFIINRGKATYFGNLNIVSPDLADAHRTKDVTLEVVRSNRSDRDIPLFLSNYHGFTQASILVDPNLSQ